MEHQRCYIYTPPDTEEPVSKRQRISKADPRIQLTDRLATFREIWSTQEERIQDTLEEADRTTQENIVNFIATVPTVDAQAIPTGLVIAGPSIASHAPFFERLGRKIKAETKSTYVVLTSGECSNLKTLLKNLIKKATSRLSDDDDDDIVTSTRSGPKLLDFDIGHLQEWQKRNQVKNIIITIQDSEAFDANVLAELIDILYSWLDRLPFVLLFGIATSAESFEDRLSGKSLRFIEGQKFDVTQSDEIVEKLFSTTVASTDVPLWIGPNLARRILDRQKDHVQNAQDFCDGLKYAYMSHFYASAPTIFLNSHMSFNDISSESFESVRNLPSFRNYVESLIDEGRTSDARTLLNSDKYLFEMISEHIQSGQGLLNTLSGASAVLVHLRRFLQMSPSVPLSSIWIRAASGEMIGSPFFRETMLLIKKISSDKLVQLLDFLSTLNETIFVVDISAYQQELEDLVKTNKTSAPLRTQDDVRTDSMRTTVVAQKVLLSKHKAALSEQDKAYSELIGKLHSDLESYFTTAFADPRTLFLSEILIYDLKSPHTEVFQPRPRFSIERALTSPHDYLGCECCGPDGERDGEGALLSTQPATAILYQMYLESGTLINASDLWLAFNAIVGAGEEGDSSKTTALFQRALAELKYLGLVKPTRKKTDHIAKMTWKGL